MSELTVNCDSCGANDTTLVFTSTLQLSLDQSDFTVLGELGEYPQIVRCNACGLTYANPRDDGEALVGKYKDMSVSEYLEEEESRKLITDKDAKLIESLCHNGRILDIGCSAGLFLSSMADHYEKTGIEPSIRAAAVATKNLPDARIYNMPLTEAPLDGEKFDAITLWDVIEHLDSPSSALIDIHKHLADDGHLAMVTPDIGSLLARLMGKRWTHLIRGHIFYFTRKTMEQALNRSGYEVVSISSYSRYFKIRYVLKRIGLIGLGPSWTDKLGFLDITIPINLGDAMLVIARKTRT